MRGGTRRQHNNWKSGFRAKIKRQNVALSVHWAIQCSLFGYVVGKKRLSAMLNLCFHCLFRLFVLMCNHISWATKGKSIPLQRPTTTTKYEKVSQDAPLYHWKPLFLLCDCRISQSKDAYNFSRNQLLDTILKLIQLTVIHKVEIIEEIFLEIFTGNFVMLLNVRIQFCFMFMFKTFNSNWTTSWLS